MSHIVRISKLFKKAHDLSAKLMLEEQIAAKEAFEHYLEGTKYQARKYHNLALIEAHPAFTSFLAIGLGFATQNQQIQQLLPKIFDGGLSGYSKYYQANVNQFERTDLKRRDLRHTQAIERGQQAQRFMEQVNQIFTNVLNTAAGK